MDAFAELFEELRPTMYAVAYRLVGAADADDVVMDSFLKAWQGLPRFRGKAALKSWLFRIVHNCAVDRLRKRERRKTVSLTCDVTERAVERDISESTAATPSEIAAGRDFSQHVQDALATLSTAHRVVLELRYVDGLQYNEIAAATGVSIGTVMSRLFHARRRLRAGLSQKLNET